MFSRAPSTETNRPRNPRFLSRLPPLPEKRAARVICPPSHIPNPLLLPAAEGVATWMHPRVQTFTAGELWAVTLDKACVVQGAYRLARTLLAPVPALIAQLLRFCDADGACRVVLVHRDIGGAGTVSGEVLTLTTHLCALCRTVGIEILDQLVFDVRMKYTSLRKRGFFDSHRWLWPHTIYPTVKDLERHRIRKERMVRTRRRAGHPPEHTDASPMTHPLPPVGGQAAHWVHTRLLGARAPELWAVVVDSDDCICGAFHAGKPDALTVPALLAGIVVHTKHLGSARVVLVEGLVPHAASPSGHPEWASALSHAAQSVGVQIVDHVLVNPSDDDCRVSR